ncbi:regulating synaptic membrane exocytosis protein 2-like [Palaemon carinicauda]|uniref:regulating synaptic membrane exocytosis protein 2-like n=1 Tax=Palaemon carinicauda TaxID=392227 RepID=UPI0035B5C9AE
MYFYYYCHYHHVLLLLLPLPPCSTSFTTAATANSLRVAFTAINSEMSFCHLGLGWRRVRGRVGGGTITSPAVIWVCIVCRKKQELLIKSGSWMNASQQSELMHLELEYMNTRGLAATPTADKRPKLDRTNSSENETRPTASVLGMGGSGQLPPATSAAGGGALALYPQESEGLRCQSQEHHQFSGDHHPSPLSGYHPSDLPHHAAYESSHPMMQRAGSAQGRELQRQYSQEKGGGGESGGGGPGGRVPRGRVASEGGESQLSPLARERQLPFSEGFRTYGFSQDCEAAPVGGSPDIRVERGYGSAVHGAPVGGGGVSDAGGAGGGGAFSTSSARYSPVPGATGGSSPMEGGSSPGLPSLEGGSPHFEDPRRMHLDPAAAFGRSRERRRTDPVMRNDSLSSDQSECVRPPPPKPHKHRTRGRKARQRSLSSSDEEVRSTPECTSCEEHEAESESVSEKGEGDSASATATDRFDKQEQLDAQIKKFLATQNVALSEEHPVSWQPSQDGTRLIGHMILNKYMKGEVGPASSAAILGLKVAGGMILDNGKTGALIEKVKKGSIADTVGHLRPGDEVMEWNGRSLQNKSYEEVYDIITESRQEPQVEIFVSRVLPDYGRQPVRRATHHGMPSRGGAEPNYDPRKLSEPGRDRRPSVTITSPGSPETYQMRTHSPSVTGKLQLKLCFDPGNQQLDVTIVSAADLPPRATGQPRNPYAKMFLLPDRSEKSKRRTKAIGNSLDPRWNQTFVYCPLRRAELKTRSLEITVWDYDRYGANDFLGEFGNDLNVFHAIAYVHIKMSSMKSQLSVLLTWCTVGIATT